MRYKSLDDAVGSWAGRIPATFIKAWFWPDGMITARFETPDGAKTFRPFHVEGDEVVDGDPDGPLPLYRGNQLAAYPGDPVFLAEGEAKADVLASLGLLGICSAHGAGAAAKTDWGPVAGRIIIILPDNDAPGRKYAETVAEIAKGLDPPASVKIVALPGLGPKGDIINWVGRKGPMADKSVSEIRQELLDLVAKTGLWTPPSERAAAAEAKNPGIGITDGDLRLGREFVKAYGDRVRYCPDVEDWYVWDAKRWAPDAVHQAELLMKALIDDRLLAATRLPSAQDREFEIKYWIKNMKRSRIEAGLWIARSEPKVVVRLRDLDAAPWLLNCPNGTVNLQTGVLRRHDPADLITRIAASPFEPDADRAEWERFLARVMPDADVRAFLQRAAGYSLTGRPVEEVLFFVHGPTNGGKGTFVAAMTGALGEYAAVADFETFLKRADGNRAGPRSDLVRLAGRRFVSSQETEAGDKLASGLLKWLTGQDVICQRGLYTSEIEFLPTFSLWFFSNFKPQARDDDPALWRRLHLLPFPVSIPPEERDPQVKVRLRDPAIGGPAVLAWAIEGCRMWQEIRLRPPQDVERATKQWRSESSPVSDWLVDKTLADPEASTLFVELHASYKSWVQENNIRRPVSGITLARALVTQGFAVGTQRERTYVGIRLKSPFSTGQSADGQRDLSLDDLPPREASPY